MESGNMKVPVILKGGNYLLWSRLVKTAVGSKGLWSHITSGEAPRLITHEGDQEVITSDEEKWEQEDLLVMSVIQGSLEPSILEAYSYCEKAKDLWDTLKKVYGNISNLSRVFEVKHAINNLTQEDMEFTKHLGKFRALWSELEMLRPSTTDPDELIERKEQDKVFGLLLTLNPAYNSLIKHILRAEKLPILEDVCAQIQKEQGSIGLFGGKGDLSLANQAAVQLDQVDNPQANKAMHNKYEERRFNGNCDHCKKHGHKKSQCWILHPHLKPAKFMKEREARAHLSEGSNGAGTSKTREGEVGEAGDGKSLVAYASNSNHQSNNQDYIRRSDIDALIKMLKENGNFCSNGYSFAARTDRSLDSQGNGIGITRNARNDPVDRNGNIASIKPLIVDSGAYHHMISDRNLIRDIVPATGNVMIANGDKIPIKGIGTLNLFSKDSKAFFLPEFTSNLLSVRNVLWTYKVM